MNENELDELSSLATRLQVLDNALAAYCLLASMTVAAFVWVALSGMPFDLSADHRLCVPLNILIAAFPPVTCCFGEMTRSHNRVSQILRSNQAWSQPE
jgi:hypothetical protein